MQPHDGPLNWDFAIDLARKVGGPVPRPDADPEAEGRRRRRRHGWPTTGSTRPPTFPSGVTSTAAWSRAEWIVGTTDVWKVLVEPIAESSVSSLSGALPEEAKAMAGPIMGMLGKAVGAMLASQVGSGIGALAVRGADRLRHRAAARRAPAGPRWCRPTSRRSPRASTSSEDDVLLYLALREAAHQRLFAHVPWLREHLIGAVTDYARGIEINTEPSRAGSRSRCAASTRPTPSRCRSCSRAACSTCRSPPSQEAALQRLEVTLALVEGWVDEVVGQATAERMPSATKLQEAVRRRRAAGGPAEQTFASLVGLELRPRRLRDASHPVGLAADPAGRRGPRRRLDAPRPAADGRRPRRPARLPRGRRRSGGDERGGLRRRAAQTARRRRTPARSDPE